MDRNPYAPPTAAVADVGAPSGLKRRSVLLMIVFLFITFGFYVPIWFFRRRAALNRLDSPLKLQRWPLIVVCVVYAVDFVVNIVSGMSGSQSSMAGIAGVLAIARLATTIALLWPCFVTKNIIEDHLHRPAASVLFAEGVKLSGLMTFFFQIFYLQYAINRYIVGPAQRSVATV